MIASNFLNQQHVPASKGTGRLLHTTKLDRDDGLIEIGEMYLGLSNGYIVASERL